MYFGNCYTVCNSKNLLLWDCVYAWYIICIHVMIYVYLWYLSMHLFIVQGAVSIQLCYSLCILTASPYSISQFYGLGVYRHFEKHCADCFVYFIIFYSSLWWTCSKTEGDLVHSVQLWTRRQWFPASGYLYKAQHNLRQKFLRALIFADIIFVF